jgi:hypothetical protein
VRVLTGDLALPGLRRGGSLTKSSALPLSAGFSLLLPAYTGLLLAGVSTLLCPLPFLTVTPAFILSSQFSHAAVLIPPLLFFAGNPGLFKGQMQVPNRSLVLLMIATAFSVIWFAESWKYGIEYQGRHYTHAICGLNGIWLAALWIMLASRWHRDSFAGNLLLHWLLFAWLGWYAFPYLGELP